MDFLIDKNLLRFISFLGGIQGIILSILVLFYPKKYKSSNLLLFAFLLSLTLIIWAPRLHEVLPSKLMWPIIGVRFTSLMFLYWYIKNLYREIDWKNEWWNAPLILVHLLLTYLEYSETFPSSGVNAPLFVGALLIDTGTITLYFALLFHSLQAYRQKLETHFSSQHQMGYWWSRELVWGFMIITIYQALRVIFSGIFPDSTIAPYLSIVNTLLFTVYMYFIAIKGKLTPEVYQLRRSSTWNPIESTANPVKSPLKNESEEIDSHLTDLANRAKDYMEEKKPYLNPTLTLQEFSDALNVKSYLVSQAINQVLNLTFFDLVNSYRVEEAKVLLLDDQLNHLSVLGIGFEAGFNSKTTFNTTFKKMTGLTPTAYKQKFQNLSV